jgi:predicted PurR-regulated permease PerM
MKRGVTEVTISNHTIVRVVVIVLLTFLGIRFVAQVSHALQLIAFSVFLGIGLNPAVGWIAKKLRLKSRASATAIAYVLVVAFLGVILTNVVPPLVRQTVTFVQNAPSAISDLKTGNSPAARFVQRNNLQDDIDSLSEEIAARTQNVQEPVVATAGKIGSALLSLITVLVLTFMVIVEGPSWLKRYWNFLSPTKRAHHQKLAKRMYGVITGYVNGQVLISFIGSSFMLVALLIASSVLDVSINVLAMAGIVFVTSLVPMIGAAIGGVIVVLSCSFVSAPLAVIIAVYLVLYQQLENTTLQPYIQSRNNELTPLLVFVAAILGASFAGILGAVVAIPTAGCARILLQDFLSRRQPSA